MTTPPPRPDNTSSSPVASILVRGAWYAAMGVVLAPAAWMILRLVWGENGIDLSPLIDAYSSPSRLLTLMGNSLGVIGCTLAISLSIGLPTGYLCFRTNLPGRRIYLMGALWAATLPLYVTTGSWMGVMGSAFWLTLDSPLALIIGAGWLQGVAYIPLVALISGATFACTSAPLEDAALIDGSRWQVIRFVTLPEARWAVAMSALAVTVLCFADITVTDILAVRTFAEETFTQFVFQGNATGATATALPIILVLGILAKLFTHRLQGWQAESTGETVSTWRLPLPAALGAGLLLLVAAAMVVIPLAFLVRAVRSVAEFKTGVMAADQELMYSAMVTPLVMIVTVTLALPWAWELVRGRFCQLHGWLLIGMLAIPAPIIGTGAIELFNQPGWLGQFYDSPGIVVLVQVIRALPLCALVLVPAIWRIPTETLEASKLEGATWLRTLWSLVLPQAWRHVLGCASVAGILSLGEVGASFMVMPPGNSTVTVRFFSLIHYGLYSNAAALCLVVVLILGLPAAIIGVVLAAWFKRRFA